MTSRVVLDAAAFDVLTGTDGGRLRYLLRRAVEQDGEVHCAAVTLAEVCRGTVRTRRVEAALVRSFGGPRVRVVPTDEALAKLVGAILFEAGVGSEFIADAHVVGVCAGADTAIVVTSDPDDITRLAGSLRGVRVLTHAVR